MLVKPVLVRQAFAARFRTHVIGDLQQGEKRASRAILEKEGFIGTIDLRTKENDNRGFWLGLPWQGQGLMSEACEAVTDFWFETLKFPVLRAPKSIQNAASRRISEKQGMRMISSEERDYVSGRLPSEIWEITAEEWRARKVRGRTND